MSGTSPQIRTFIKLANDYNLRKTEKNIAQLQRQLQILSMVSDLSTFEPRNAETLEFFTCLQKLLLANDSRSPLPWKVINLLMHICRSPSIRSIMRDQMQFLQVMSPLLLTAKLSKDKISKLLHLLQDLSYGVQIQRREGWLIKIIPYLINLILDSEDIDDVIELAVATLANLCRGNIPSIMLLIECSERKTLLRTLTNLKSPSIRVQMLVSEIMIYVNVDHTKLGIEQIMHTLDLLFMVAIDGFADQDETLLHLSKDVFNEMISRMDLRETVKGYTKFGSAIQNILNYVTPESNAECVGILFGLMALVVKLEHEDFIPHFDILLSKSLPWLPEKKCDSGTQNLLLSLLSVASDKIIETHVEEFALLIKESLMIKEHMSPTLKTADWLSSMLMLAESLFEKHTSFQSILAKSLIPPAFSSLLYAFLELIEGVNSKNIIQSRTTPSCTRLHFPDVHQSKALCWLKFSETVLRILSLTNQLSDYDPQFKVEYREMLANSKVMEHVVLCQKATDIDIVTRATNLLYNQSIPNENLNALVKAQVEANKQTQISQNLENLSQPDAPLLGCQVFPTSLMSTPSSSFPTAEAAIDGLLDKLNSAAEKAELRDLPLTQVMELYEYKLTNMNHTKQYLEEALAASDTLAREIKMTAMKEEAETCHLRTLVLTWEERVQQLQKEKQELEKCVVDVTDSARKLRTELVQEKTTVKRNNAKYNSDMTTAKRDIEGKEEEIRRLQRVISESIAENKALQKQISHEQEETQKSKEVIKGLEQREKKSRKEIEELEKETGRLEKVQTSLKKEKAELEMLIRSHEETLLEKDSQIEEMVKQNSALKRIQDMIHNISSGKVSKMPMSPGK